MANCTSVQPCRGSTPRDGTETPPRGPHWWEAESTYAILERIAPEQAELRVREADRISSLFDRLGDRGCRIPKIELGDE